MDEYNYNGKSLYMVELSECNIFLDHSCAIGYTLSSVNHICGTQQSGSSGEINLGGPEWPSADSTKTESEQECAKACNQRAGCIYYMWFDDKGCRTQTSCTQTVSIEDWAASSFICKKEGNLFLHCSLP